VETVAKNSNLGRIPIEIALVEAAEPPIYLKIGEKARHLRELGTSDKAIARALGVSDKTVAKAIERWGSTAPSTRPA
jgi:transposase-like protein